MEKIVIAILICLPTLALSAAVGQCQYGEKKFNPGETATFDEHCSQRACTCDKDGSGSVMCNRKLTGCLTSDQGTCYKVNSQAVIKEAKGIQLHCTCQQRPDGTLIFADCRSDTCKDSRTGAEKKKGESVTTTKNGVTYVCTCAGVDGYKACRTEESISRDNKCLDDASGKYVPTGSKATTKQGATVMHCTCSGTNSYTKCLPETCTDVDGSEKKAGERVTIRSSGELHVCQCAGVNGFEQCQTKADFDNAAKCKGSDGKYVAKGKKYRVKENGENYECTCDGSNVGKQCSVQCKFGGRTLAPGQKHTFVENCIEHTCTCDLSLFGSSMCQSKIIGCFDKSSNKCYKVDSKATVKPAKGSNLQCTCQKQAGKFIFADCRSETCKDSRTGAEKKKGESVITTKNGVTYFCTCAGVDGYTECRTEEIVSRDNKCLDDATGKYVPIGAAATTKQGATVMHCTCYGTNSYGDCRPETCTDVDGSVKKFGHRVTVRRQGALYSCLCAGVAGYEQCLVKGDFDNATKCKGSDGKYAEKGEKYRVKHNGSDFDCICTGNNNGRCRPAVT